jgi:hypothetical protein
MDDFRNYEGVSLKKRDGIPLRAKGHIARTEV